MSRRNATSVDVAKAVGVSQSTVSRALRGQGGMSEATRRRIVDMAAALGYVPIEGGRALSTRATKRIGIICPDLKNQFYPELIEPLRIELHDAGYRAVLIPDQSDTQELLLSLADGSLDGVVVTTALLGSQLPYQLHARGVPVVLVNRELDSSAIDTCVMDNQQGGFDVASLLAELGHRRVAAILGPADTSTSRERETGFRAGLAESGIAIPRARIKQGEFSHEAGFAAAGELLDLAEAPTAIFCANDVIALGAFSAVAARGLRVGRDVTLVGFDDISMAGWSVFSLTTVLCDLPGMARTGIDLLTRRIEASDRPAERVVLKPQLVLRSTHGPPPD